MKVIVLGVFVAAVVSLQQFVISESDEVHHRRKAAFQQLSARTAQVETGKLVPVTHYDDRITSQLAKNT